MNTLLHARGLLKTFREGEVETPVLKGVDLDLWQGEFTALMGASGSGKSTLLSILGALLRPTSGTLEISDQDVFGMSTRETAEFRNGTIGFVFQFHHLLPDFTALENVIFPSYPDRRSDPKRARRRATHLLNRIGLGDRIHYRATQLSGGQRQRVAVARAVMNRPKLVLADEPTGNLDRENSEKLMGLFHELVVEEQTTLLISTHDPEVASQCKRVLHLVDGQMTRSSD